MTSYAKIPSKSHLHEVGFKSSWLSQLNLFAQDIKLLCLLYGEEITTHMKDYKKILMTKLPDSPQNQVPGLHGLLTVATHNLINSQWFLIFQSQIQALRKQFNILFMKIYAEKYISSQLSVHTFSYHISRDGKPFHQQYKKVTSITNILILMHLNRWNKNSITSNHASCKCVVLPSLKFVTELRRTHNPASC